MTLKENVFDVEAIEAQIKINREREDIFAIGFAEWILDNYNSDNSSMFNIFYKNNMHQLLEIYKKEKGL